MVTLDTLRAWALSFPEVTKVREDLFLDALTTAYCEVAPKKLAEQVRPRENE